MAEAPSPNAAEAPSPNAADINLEYYNKVSAGKDQYWRLMAAPRHRVAVIVQLIERFRPESVVDLGCGNGQLLEEVSRAFPGVRLHGIDLSEHQIEDNKSRQPGISWAVSNLEQPLPQVAPGKRFDLAVASELIEHMDNPANLLANCRELLKPETGRLVLSTQSGPVRETERRVGHQRHFTASEMRVLLDQAGWIDMEVWNTGFPFHDLSKWYANLRPDRMIQKYANQEYGWSQRAVCALLRAAFALNSRKRGAQLFATARAPRRIER